MIHQCIASVPLFSCCPMLLHGLYMLVCGVRVCALRTVLVSLRSSMMRSPCHA